MANVAQPAKETAIPRIAQREDVSWATMAPATKPPTISQIAMRFLLATALGLVGSATQAGYIPGVHPASARYLPSAILCRIVPSDDLMLSHPRRGALEYCVLSLLAGQERYGLDIARELTADGILMSSAGTLYPLLARLRRAGWVETSWQESSEGPPRRYYFLTTGGAVALDDFKGSWKLFRDAVDAALETPREIA